MVLSVNFEHVFIYQIVTKVSEITIAIGGVLYLFFVEQILDEYSAATQAAIDVMISNCEEKTLREINTYWKKDASGNLGPPQEIGNNLCPNDCSGNGICLNGTCKCSNNFTTADCSLKKGIYLTEYSKTRVDQIAFNKKA